MEVTTRSDGTREEPDFFFCPLYAQPTAYTTEEASTPCLNSPYERARRRAPASLLASCAPTQSKKFFAEAFEPRLTASSSTRRRLPAEEKTQTAHRPYVQLLASSHGANNATPNTGGRTSRRSISGLRGVMLGHRSTPPTSTRTAAELPVRYPCIIALIESALACTCRMRTGTASHSAQATARCDNGLCTPHGVSPTAPQLVIASTWWFARPHRRLTRRIWC